MDPDPDADPHPLIFVIDLQEANKKLIFKKFFCLLLFEGTFTSFLKIKSQKEVANNRNQGFSYFICLMIEESRMLKNIRIRRIRIWIRIRNTAKTNMFLVPHSPHPATLPPPALCPLTFITARHFFHT
jgi:hypothetical protein